MSLGTGDLFRDITAVDSRDEDGVIATGTFVELARFDTPMLVLTQQELKDYGALSYDHAAVAAWIETPNGYTSYVAGMFADLTLPDSPPGTGEARITALTPIAEYPDADAAIASAQAYSELFSLTPRGGGLNPVPPPDPYASCYEQYNLCVSAAHSRYLACGKNCLAATIAEGTACCVACLASPFPPACCIVCGVGGLVYEVICFSACGDEYNAALADCRRNLLACDPRLVGY